MSRKTKVKKRRSEAEEDSSDEGSNADEQQTWAFMPFACSPNRTQHKTHGNRASTAFTTFQPAPLEKKESKPITVVWELSATNQEHIVCSMKETDLTSVEDFLYKFIFQSPDFYFDELFSPSGVSSKSKVVIDLSLGPKQCIRIANTNEDVDIEGTKRYIYRIGLKSTYGVLQPTDTLYDLISDRHEEISIVKLGEGTTWGIIGTKGHDTIQTRLVYPTSPNSATAVKTTATKSPTKAAKKPAPASPKKTSAKKKLASPKANKRKPAVADNNEARDNMKASEKQSGKVVSATKTTTAKGGEIDKAMEGGSKAGAKSKVMTEKTSLSKKKRKAADTEVIEVEAAKSKKKAKKDPNAPKRPISAFFLFLKAARPKFVAENNNVMSTEVNKMLGARWKELSAEKKKKYEKEANADRERYVSEKEAYDAKVAEEGNKDSDGDVEPMETADSETENEEDDDSAKKKAAVAEVVEAEATKSSKKAKKDPNSPKRPASAYICFCIENRAQVTAKNPDAKGTGVVKILGSQWRELSDKGKMKYEKEAKALRERYVSEKETYDAKVAKEAEEGNEDFEDDDEEDDDSASGDKKKAADTDKKAKKDPNAPKRPISAFFLFLKAARPKFIAENTSVKSSEVNKILGAKWRELSAKKKKKYEKEATADRERYLSEKEAYDEKVDESNSKVRVKKNPAKKDKPEQDVGESMDFDAESMETDESEGDEPLPSPKKVKKKAKKNAKQPKTGRVVTI